MALDILSLDEPFDDLDVSDLNDPTVIMPKELLLTLIAETCPHRHKTLTSLPDNEEDA